MIRIIDPNNAIIEAMKPVCEKHPQYLSAECGSLFDAKYTASVVVAAGNSFGIMDGGLDLLMKNKWRGVQERVFREIECAGGICPVGDFHLLHIKDLTGGQYVDMIYLPTMLMPKDISGTINIFMAFSALKNYKNHDVICPGLGTGSGNVSPKIFAKQVDVAMQDRICEKWNDVRNLLGELI